MAVVCEKTTTVMEAIQLQAETLQEAARQAETALETVRKNEQKNQRALFLHSAQFITQELHSLGYDLAKLLYNDVDETMWKQFSTGDTSIFTRWLARRDKKTLVEKIVTRYRSDPETRTHMMRYVNAFEELTNSLEFFDTGGLLKELFFSSDTGKLYLLLKYGIRHSQTGKRQKGEGLANGNP